MALWKYTFRVLPKDSVETISPDYNFIKDPDQGLFDDEPYWMLNPISRDMFYEISKILPKSISWSKHIDLYGDQESNCFEVLFENDNIASVSFRIDFRSNYEQVLISIVEFCLYNGLIIIDENLESVPFNIENLKAIINTSQQVKMYNKLAG